LIDTGDDRQLGVLQKCRSTTEYNSIAKAVIQRIMCMTCYKATTTSSFPIQN